MYHIMAHIWHILTYCSITKDGFRHTKTQLDYAALTGPLGVVIFQNTYYGTYKLLIGLDEQKNQKYGTLAAASAVGTHFCLEAQHETSAVAQLRHFSKKAIQKEIFLCNMFSERQIFFFIMYNGKHTDYIIYLKISKMDIQHFMNF